MQRKTMSGHYFQGGDSTEKSDVCKKKKYAIMYVHLLYMHYIYVHAHTVYCIL